VEEYPSQRRRLGSALRVLRERAGLSTRDVAARIGRDQSKISRVERGLSPAPPPLVEAWAQACGASDEQIADLREQALLALAEGHPAKLEEVGGVAASQERMRELEASAGTILNFSNWQAPGLLQTADYMRALFTILGVADVGRSIAARLDRQLMLYHEGKRFEFVMPEAALSYRVGPPRLLVAQLAHFGQVATLDNIAFGIVPANAPAPAPFDCSIGLYQDREGGEPPAAVEEETVSWGVIVEDPARVRLHVQRYDALRSAAVFGDAARALLDRVADDLRRRSG
jgi:transcriptional regulator with XRE-family HTH domain